ncbi:MAG: hypothetical protein COV44_06360 [Deltaproteobacteria bacterium CG11_big_fil_rev_8_21_14_0_20_45_16]|nr:MAG: hypothetical protein COV44_06360 [Deltaproteobacteria bacterium CG11_big_fil_rev_8_21_14_0_20_45_16]
MVFGHEKDRWIFLGLGKTTRVSARYFNGELLCLFETAKGVDEFRFDREANEWVLSLQFSEETFDSLEWQGYKPSSFILSPGIDPRRAFYAQIQSFEVREMDLFRQFFRGRCILVTGTNGKSSLAARAAFLLEKHLGEGPVFLGGNFGRPMLDICGNHFAAAVLEISSFQAERLKSAQFDLGVLLNLSPDHLDRYATAQQYYEAKLRLLDRCALVAIPSDLPVSYFRASESLIKFESESSQRVILRSLFEKLSKIWNFKLQEDLFDQLPNLPHRLERKQLENGAWIINDSKATNVESTLYALKQIQPEFSRILLILGGKSKGGDFSRIASMLRPSDEAHLYGQAREEIGASFERAGKECLKYKSLSELLKFFQSKLKAEDCLLLAPACASFDEFRNYEERGRFFFESFPKAS